VIVIDRLVAGRSIDAPHEVISGILAKGDGPGVARAPKVASYGLANEKREWDPATSRLILQFPVRLFGEP
jgi:hypothetical protein